MNLKIKNFYLWDFFKTYSIAMLYVIYFFPSSFIFSNTKSAINNLLKGEGIVVNFHFKFIFHFILLCYVGFRIFKAETYQKRIFFKTFTLYIGILTFLFINTWIFQGSIQWQSEEYAFFLYFLPSVFLALGIEEKIFLRCLQILCCVLGIFFIKWFFYGKFFEKDYLGFYTCISLCGMYFATCNLTSFCFYFALFSYYLFTVWYLGFFGSGIGQIFAFLFCIFTFLFLKKHIKSLLWCTICLSALCFFTPNSILHLKSSILYKIDVRKKLIQAKEVQAKEVQAKEVQAKEVQAKEVQAKEVQAKEVQAKGVQKLFIINRYRLKSSMLTEECFFVYPHNLFVESYIVYGILGLLWYCLVNIFAFIGLMNTKRKSLFVLVFIFLSLISLKQGSILTQKLLILFHVFGLKMFFQYKYLKTKEYEIKKF
ncbi:MAG: hypothetical protein ACLRFH_01625 [Opitutales bacterium]